MSSHPQKLPPNQTGYRMQTVKWVVAILFLVCQAPVLASANLAKCINSLNELVDAAENATEADALVPLRMALYELDLAAHGKKPSEAEKEARQKARTLLAKLPVPQPWEAAAWKLYSADYLKFSDPATVCKGDLKSMVTHKFDLWNDGYFYCPKYQPIDGVFLYKEDIDRIMAHVGVYMGSTEDKRLCSVRPSVYLVVPRSGCIFTTALAAK